MICIYVVIGGPFLICFMFYLLGILDYLEGFGIENLHKVAAGDFCYPWHYKLSVYSSCQFHWLCPSAGL